MLYLVLHRLALVLKLLELLKSLEEKKFEVLSFNWDASESFPIHIISCLAHAFLLFIVFTNSVQVFRTQTDIVSKVVVVVGVLFIEVRVVLHYKLL